MLCLQNLCEVRKRFKEALKLVITTAIDSKQTELDKIESSNKEIIIKYINSLKNLLAHCMMLDENVRVEKRCAQLWSFKKNDFLLDNIIQMSKVVHQCCNTTNHREKQ